jgi:biofilm PGA synthesis N-glycosyltransferase PgaC
MQHFVEAAVLSAFWVSVAVTLYAYVGYPALLCLLAWLRPAPPVKRTKGTPRVSLVIVAHNEESVIAAKLRNCLQLDYPRDRLEIVVVSDGSTDRTQEIVRSFAAEGVRLVDLPGPRGKPAALNEATAGCTGEVLVMCDARQRLAPDAVLALAESLGDPSVGAASGELHIESGGGTGAAEGVGAYWRYEKLVRRLQSRVDSTVGVTGALYALRARLFRPLDPRTILDDVAVPMDAVAAGYRVIFEPAARAYDAPSETPAREYRRKVRTLAGSLQLVRLRPWLLDPRRNRRFLHFISHKLARLAVPWCLLVIFLGSAVLTAIGGGVYRQAYLVQTVFYAAAGAGWALDRFGLRVTVLALPYAFVLLNAAALAAPFSYLAGRERAAWRGETA